MARPKVRQMDAADRRELEAAVAPPPKKDQHEPSWSVSFPGGGSTSSSQSTTYDYSGQDLIYKMGDTLSQTGASRMDALAKGDIEGALSAGRRIADLKGYLDHYRATGGAGGAYDGVFGHVVPGMRIGNQSSSASISQPSGGSLAHGGRTLQLG